MKSLLLTLFLAVGSFAQFSTISGQTHVTADTVRWDSDSSISLLARGSTLYKDSANTGTYVAVDDSCSNPFPLEKRGKFPVWKNELRYNIRSTATDSSTFRIRFDTRYCADARNSLLCEDWTAAGKHAGTMDVTMLDSLSTDSALVTTAHRQSKLYYVTGSQARACVVPLIVGGESGDSTFLTKVINRTQ